MSLTFGQGVRRASLVAITALSLVVAGGPALAKTPAHTTISAHLTASTVLVKSTATVSGVVSPAGGTVALERLVSAKWVVVAHAKPNRSGGYDFSVRAPKAGATWPLRVVRGASSTTKSGVSATVSLHVVTKQFIVAAASPSTVTAPAAAVVTGVVVPAASGTVQVQRLVGSTWTVLATGRIGAGGTFSINVTLPVGAAKLRVVKPFTSSVAQGTSASIGLTVAAAPAPASPTVVTAALPAARVGVAYATLLTAGGGNGFYQWAATGLPAGLTLSAAGLLAGIPTAQGTASFTATVTDAAGHSGSASLTVTSAAAAGRLFAVGDNSAGYLGNGTTTNAHTFVPVLGMPAVTTAAAGGLVALAVKTDGSVWAWGPNAEGELGNGTTNPSSAPVQVTALSGVTAVAAGYKTSYALKSDGTVWAWGYNSDGEIGDGTAIGKDSPVQVSSLTSVVAISSSQNTAYALKSDGTVWAWGMGTTGELGNGDDVDSSSPVQVSGLTGIKAISSATHSGYALRSDGTVAAWGADDADELGDGAPSMISTHAVTVAGLSNVTQISGALNTAYALTSSGAVFGWGYNGSSELGGATVVTPSGVVQIPVGPGALEVAGGFEAAYSLLPDHTVVAWGLNDSGQLGIGSTTNAAIPTAMSGVTNVFAVISGGFANDVLLIAN